MELQRNDSLYERILEEKAADLEVATALNNRMRAAWQIVETDIRIGNLIASGSFGVVHEGESPSQRE